MNDYFNLYNEEPEFKCPKCNTNLHTDWVDNGFGAFSVQASPYLCDSCGWAETGCKRCVEDRCFSWKRCQGRAVEHDTVKQIDDDEI